MRIYGKRECTYAYGAYMHRTLMYFLLLWQATWNQAIYREQRVICLMILEARKSKSSSLASGEGLCASSSLTEGRMTERVQVRDKWWQIYSWNNQAAPMIVTLIHCFLFASASQHRSIQIKPPAHGFWGRYSSHSMWLALFSHRALTDTPHASTLLMSSSHPSVSSGWPSTAMRQTLWGVTIPGSHPGETRESK